MCEGGRNSTLRTCANGDGSAGGSLENLQHEAGRRENACVVSDAQSMVGGWQDQTLNRNQDAHWPDVVALARGRHRAGSQTQSKVAPWSEAKGGQAMNTRVAIYARIS